MRHSLAKFVFILVLVKIDRLDSKPVQVVYTGDGCECPKNLPYHIHIPVVPEPEPVEYCYGYTVDSPPPPKPKYAYSFDFVVDEPIVTTPAPIPSSNLFAIVDKIVMPKPDCVLDKVAPCGIPAVEELPLPPPPPPVLPKFKACKYHPTKPCTCGVEIDVPVVVAKSCACGQCNPLKPSVCRYVSNTNPNRIAKLGRSKRDITTRKYPIIEFFKAQKAARDAKALEARDAQGEPKMQKSKIVKRDIKGEYDLLEKDQAALDLTLPEIIQYMPETLMPNFKRGKCNIGCKNCVKKRRKTHKSTQKTVLNETHPEQQQQPIATTMEYSQTLPNQQFPSSPQFAGASFLKRSVNPYQYPCPCNPAMVPPQPYSPSQLHLTTLAQNPGNPVWIQPQPLTNPNGHYVYDRLGHKYEVNNGSLKLVTPPIVDEVNVSAPATPAVAGNDEANVQATAMADQPIAGDAQVPSQQADNVETTIVGAPVAHPVNPSHDPQMDKVIRDIIYQHPDFINAGVHAPGSLTQPQNVQRDETMQFLGKLIRGRLDNWFGVNEHAPSQQLDDMNRYSRETGTTVKFIPVVTVDKDKLNKYRLDQIQAVQ